MDYMNDSKHVGYQDPYFQHPPHFCNNDQLNTSMTHGSENDNGDDVDTDFDRIENRFISHHMTAPEQAMNHTNSSDDVPDMELLEEYNDDIAASNEQTGRWTRKEHETFLEALKKFGKEWKKVASIVKTRTVVQTRTHAQKYFQKLHKSGGGGNGGGEYSGDEQEAGQDNGFGSKLSNEGNMMSEKTPRMNGEGKGGGGVWLSLQHSAPYPNFLPSTNLSTGQSRVVAKDINSSPFSTGKRKHSDGTVAGATSCKPKPSSFRSKNSQPGVDQSLVDSNYPYSYPAHIDSKTAIQYGNSCHSDNYYNNEKSGDFHPSSSRESQSLMKMEGEGAHVLYMMKGKNPASASSSDLGDYHLQGGGFDTDSPFSNSRASIASQSQLLSTAKLASTKSSKHGINGPENYENNSYENNSYDGNGEEIQSFEAHSAFIPNENEEGKNGLLDNEILATSLKVSTKAQQRDFLKRVTNFLDSGHEGLSQLEALLQGATKAAEMERSIACEERPEETGISSSVARALNRPDPAGCTALMHACSPSPSCNEEEGLKSVDNDSRSSNEEVMLATCSLLISYGALPGACDVTGSNCLHRCAFLGYEKVGRMLVLNGCEVNCVNLDGDAAIHIAAREGHAKFLEMLDHVLSGNSSGDPQTIGSGRICPSNDVKSLWARSSHLRLERGEMK